MLLREKEKHKIQENENTAVLEQLKTHKGKISCKSLVSDFVAAFGAGGGRKDGRCPYSGQQKSQGYFSLDYTCWNNIQSRWEEKQWLNL